MTVASLIENEAKLAEERPLVASVIYNRLKTGMALGVDSTVIYASKLAGKWRNDGKVYLSDIERDSPYNTRKVRGLPPGPIASPGASSLEAALKPAQTDYLYYVREPSRNDGAHNFYNNAADFERGVQALREWERTRNATSRRAARLLRRNSRPQIPDLRISARVASEFNSEFVVFAALSQLRPPPVTPSASVDIRDRRLANVKKIFALALLSSSSPSTRRRRRRAWISRTSGSGTTATTRSRRQRRQHQHGADAALTRQRQNGRAPDAPNPYRFSVPNDVLAKSVAELMRERKMIVDDTVSKPDEGLLISQPYTFTKGSVITASELNRLAEVPRTDLRNWTRGRYTIIVEVQPIDSAHTNISVNARIEGRSDGVLGAEWVSLRSNGTAEEEFLIALIEKVTGGPPPGREQ